MKFITHRYSVGDKDILIYICVVYAYTYTYDTDDVFGSWQESVRVVYHTQILGTTFV